MAGANASALGQCPSSLHTTSHPSPKSRFQPYAAKSLGDFGETISPKSVRFRETIPPTAA